MKLDKNLRKKMFGLLPFDEEVIEKFTPKEFEKLPKEFQPVFHIKPLSASDKDKASLTAEKASKSGASKKDQEEWNEVLNEITRTHLLNIENLYDVSHNKFIEIKKDESKNCIHKDIWDKLPKKTQNTLYFCLTSISGITDGESMGL